MEFYNKSSKSDLLACAEKSAQENFIEGLLDGAFRHPARALQELATGTVVAKSPADMKEATQPSRQLGNIIGTFVPLIAVSIFSKGLTGRIFASGANRTEQGILQTLAEHGSNGFILGSVLTPSELNPGETLLGSRLRQGASSAVTFATMGGSSRYLEKLTPQLGLSIFSNRTARSLLIASGSGASGGIVDAELRTGFKASPEQILTSAAGFASLGIFMETGNAYAKALGSRFKPAESSPLKFAYGTVSDAPLKTKIIPPAEREPSIAKKTNSETLLTRKSETPNALSTSKTTERTPVQSSTTLDTPRINNKASNENTLSGKSETARTKSLPEETPDSLKELVLFLEKRPEHLSYASKDPYFRPLFGKELRLLRESTLNELKWIDAIEEDGQAFNLFSSFMHNPHLTDAQKLRITDALCTLRKTSESDSDKTKWFQSQLKLAEVLASTPMEKPAGKIDLEQEILSAIFSPYPSAERNAAARPVMTSVGYPEEQIAQLEHKQEIYSIEHPGKLIKINDGTLAKQSSLTIQTESQRQSIQDLDGACFETLTNGRRNLISANFKQEKILLLEKITNQFGKGKRTQRILDLQEAFEQRKLPREEKALFYCELNRLLESGGKFPEESKMDLAEQCLNHAAFPETIQQGNNNTCNVTTCEVRLYSRTPHFMAGILADLCSTGKYITDGGYKIDLGSSRTGMRPDSHARRSLKLQKVAPFDLQDVKADGYRDWSSQLIQTTLAKIVPAGRTITINRKTNERVHFDRMAYDKNSNLFGVLKEGKLEVLVNQKGEPIAAGESCAPYYRRDGAYIQEVRPENLVYDSYGQVAGCVSDLSNIEYLYDQFGQAAAKTRYIDNYFDKNGQLICFRTSEGSISYDKVCGRPVDDFLPSEKLEHERLHATHLGTRLYLKDTDSSGVTSMINGPELNTSKYRNICNEVTGSEPLPISICFGKRESDLHEVFVSNIEELEAALIRFEEQNNLPGIIAVDTRNPPWNRIRGGGHVLNFHGYDRAKKLVKLTNEWGSENNFLDPPMKLQTLFEAVRDWMPPESK